MGYPANGSWHERSCVEFGGIGGIAGGTMKNYMGVGVALGVGAGTALGVALHNIPVWVAIGAALGAAFGLVMNRRGRNSR